MCDKVSIDRNNKSRCKEVLNSLQQKSIIKQVPVLRCGSSVPQRTNEQDSKSQRTG